MACFLVPMAEAIVVTLVKTIIEKKEQKALALEMKKEEINDSSLKKSQNTLRTRLSWSRKLSWLNNLLWGGVLLLALEHLWHGEIVPWPPFLTAIRSPDSIVPMLHEIATVGTSMAIFVTITWGIMVLVAEQKVKRIPAKAQEMR
ncbi:MAG: hypothetical protein PHV32_04235 [Eubacteriales bacterium]|nr:hypothetical protein [Eubacteriales bacterium]